MKPPWSVTVTDEAPLSLVPVLHGEAWLWTEGAEPKHLTAGDVLLVRSPTTYLLASTPEVRTSATIGPGQACSGPDGRDLSAEFATDIRTWGNDPDGTDVILVGSYRSDGEVDRLLLGALPPWLVIHDPAPGIVDLLAAEISRDELGQGGVLDRLLDMLLIATLRRWISSGDRETTTWLAARRDPVVAAAIDAMHEHPQLPWTLERLAERAGTSRAGLARSFHALVGTPPMAYLTRWRMARGADLLDRTDMTIGAVAHQTGYATPFSFSTAFKKWYGLSPQAYRERDRSVTVPVRHDAEDHAVAAAGPDTRTVDAPVGADTR